MRIVYFLLTAIIFITSLLPFWLLYRLSDLTRFFLFNVFGYRKKVIHDNLRNSFPGKSDKEIDKIAKKFYKNLADIILEVIKVRTIKLKTLQKRYTYKNLDIIDKQYNNGKSVIVTIGHCGNWEWMGPTLNQLIKHRGYAVLKPLSDDFMEKYMHKIRSRFADEDQLIPFKQTFRKLAKLKDKCVLSVMAADQTPHKDEINYWSTFLHQDTPFFLGTEKIAKALDHSVVYLEIVRVKRGYYEITARLITDNPKSTGQFEITELFIKELENSIKKNPDNWLWSHRRWKYKKEI